MKAFWKNRWLLRKAAVLGLLAVAALLGAEVFVRRQAKRPEEVLAALGAQLVASQSMRVNGREVVADVWQLPEWASAAAVRKARGKALIVNKVVYVFREEEAFPARGARWPEELPACPAECDYVAETGRLRLVSGRTRLVPEAALAALASAAEAQGWTALGGGCFRRKGETLVLQATDSAEETFVSLLVEREVP